GKPLTGVVKNRRKNGDHYWVLANVTPVLNDGLVSGYMSVRSKPSREQLVAAETAYQMFREKRAGRWTLREGRLVKASRWGWVDALSRLPLTHRALALATLLVLPALAAVALFAAPGAAGWRYMAAGLLAAIATAGFLGYWRFVRNISTVLHSTVSKIEALTQGHFEETFEAHGEDEVAQLLRALQSLRTKVGYELADSRRVALESTQVRRALDVAAVNVMVADAGNQIVYANQALMQMLAAAEADIRQHLPAFRAQAVIGANIDQFHANAAHQRAMLSGLKGTHKTRLTLGGSNLDLIINPIVDQSGKRLGTVVEWNDRTQELRMEKELQDMLSGVLDGDLTTRIDLDGKLGYFAVMSRGINRLADNMAELVANAQTLAGEVYRGADEISRGTVDLSQRTEEQSSTLEETAASMEEMTTTVKQNADNASHANKLAAAARQQAESGGTVVNKAATAMAGINEASGKIANIIGIIEDLAFQTNLLALNAAVEAARAGDQGRGFAVVAAEVRNLAGRSATAAKQIKDLIVDSVRKVEAGSVLVSESGKTLERIVAAVKSVSDIIAEIATASSQQSSGIEQVSRAVVQMDEMTQQNAALVEETTVGSRSMTDQAHELHRMMERYRLAGARFRTMSASSRNG
ncbi:MAG TPA: methyl-accepting chemotaxis protein, partial [Steroidobacteraceae bacterium]